MRRRVLIAASAAVLVAGLGASAVYADIPSEDGTISTCYRASGIDQGTLHVRDSEGSCPAGYSNLSWQSASAGVAGYEVVSEALLINGPRSAGTDDRSIECPSGKVVLGASVGPDIVKGTPQADGTGWDFSIDHPAIGSGSTYQSNQRITCATVGS